MKLHLIGGFLGSGKTTAIQQACTFLATQDISVGVITNDQGSAMVDDAYFTSLAIPTRKVGNGCFCCNFSELDKNLNDLIDRQAPMVVFAESAGSCTDIVATVMKPMLKFHPSFEISVSIFADASLLYSILKDENQLFSSEVQYIYSKQLEEAGIIVINKDDLLSVSELEKLKKAMDERFSGKLLLYQNSLNTDDIKQWIRTLNSTSELVSTLPLDIDYDIYAAGEAGLAWFDEEIDVSSHTNNAIRDGLALVHQINHDIRELGYPIGHLKFFLNDKYKISFTAITEEKTDVDLPQAKAVSAPLLINARVQTSPENLTNVIAGACRKIQERTGCSIVVRSVSAFKPGYPAPQYRLTNESPDLN